MKNVFNMKHLAAATLSIILAGIATTSNVFADDCSSGAICRYDEQPGSYSRNGPYRVSNYNLRGTPGGATVYYPSNAQPPFAGLVFCPPFTGVQYMYRDWGPFFASHGIVLVTMDSRTTMDSVDQRANQQQQVVDVLMAENNNRNSPLYGKLDNSRIGVTGWSMGGGATWISASEKNGLRTAMSLAGHNLTAVDVDSKGRNIRIPTLIMNGATDVTILGGLGQSIGVYNAIPNNVPKAIYETAGSGHFVWGGPTAAGSAVGELALAFQKTFLEGDTRWARYIKRPTGNVATWRSANIPN